jgi:FtsX-like permease family
VRGPASSMLGRRMRSSGLLIAVVMLTTFIVTSLVSVLVTFDLQVLPQAVHRQLARSSSTSINIIGLAGAPAATSDTYDIEKTMTAAFGAVPYELDIALWSDPLTINRAPAEVAASGQVSRNSILTAGVWPNNTTTSENPIQAALPVTVATGLHASVGTVLSVRDANTGGRYRLVVSGLYRQRNPAAPYWGIDAIWTCDASTRNCPTTHGPIVVSPVSFGPDGFAVDQASWVIAPDPNAIGGAGLPALASRVSAADGSLPGLVASSGLPGTLTQTYQDLVVSRSLLVVGTLLLLLPALSALVLAARLLASHRETEHALLTARGAARWQLASPALAEAVLAGAVAAVAGVFAGARLAGLLAGAGLLHGAGLRLSGIPDTAWWAAAIILTLSAAIMLWPVLRLRPPATLGARPGRPSAVPGVIEAGGDIALLIVAIAAGWELRSYAGSGGTAGIDPVLAIAPALVLAGVCVIPLRLLPFGAERLDHLAVSTRRVSLALASWETSRRPVRQAGPVLLAVLAVATGTLALAQYQSWRQLEQNQAVFALGAQAEVNTPVPVPLGQTGAFAHATAVSTVVTGQGTLLAIDARTAPSTVPSGPGMPPAGLWRRLTVPPAGLALAGQPASITATLSTGHVLGVAVQDGSGAVYTLPAHNNTITLPRNGPLRLLGLSVAYEGKVAPALDSIATPTGPLAATVADWTYANGTLSPPLATSIVPAVATTAFVSANDTGVGGVIALTVGATTFSAKIVAVVTAFPSVTGAAVVVDQAAVQDVFAAQGAPPLPVTSWWLGVGQHPVTPLPAGASVTSVPGQLSALLANSLGSVPQQAGLAVAGAVALLAAVGFAAGVAASVRERRARHALLAALGVSRPAQARQLCLEELMLSGPAAVTGLLAGLGLAHLLIPSVLKSSQGAIPVQVSVQVLPVAGLVLAVIGLPVIVAAATILRRTDAAGELRGAESA